MTISPGLQFDHYEILAPVGKGGMGEVFRARDTRLNREVALKVLPVEFAQDADRLRRFELEAMATSSLNHPNILTVYDFGSHDGNPFLVMELLEGEELRAQLDAGALPVRKAIEYAQQIAVGLAAAHEKGIVHRDLKPENLFVTKDGRVKILDFGLAKVTQLRKADFGMRNEDADTLVQSPGGNPNSAIPNPQLTTPGTVMGTVAYMSPEQVRGQDLEQRSDIFSFGLILYEMLAGQRAFQKESQAETMAAIANAEPPDLSELNSKVTPQLEKIVRRCLEKKPERRFHSAHDLGFALESLATPGSAGVSPATSAGTAARPPHEEIASSSTNSLTGSFASLRSQTAGETPALPGRWRESIWVLAAGVLALVALALGVAYIRRPTVNAETIRFGISPPENATTMDSMVVSPDGRRVAVVATVEGQRRMLYVRPLNSLTTQALPGTENASTPFWSPDSQSLAFFAQGKLKKVALSGGLVSTLAEASGIFGGSWNREGLILFTTREGLQRVMASGGPTAVVTTLDQTRNELAHRSPSFLPDGRHFLYFVLGSSSEESAIYLSALDGQAPQRLVTAESQALYAPPGYLLFARGTSLLAQPFDATKQQLMGEPLPIAERPGITAVARESFSVSENGVLVYGASNLWQQYGWFDRTGKPLGLIGTPGSYGYNFKLSPDGSRLATSRRDPQSPVGRIWVFDLIRGTESRFSLEPGQGGSPVWSPDGSTIAWRALREGGYAIYRKASNGAGQEELLTKAGVSSVTDWSSDGRFLLYHTPDDKKGNDLWLLPMGGDRQPVAWLNTQFGETNGYFSPDSKWIAYTSDDSGRKEIYVQAFAAGAPASGGKWQISTKGGDHVRWRRDGKELFFVSIDQRLMSVAVKANGVSFDAGVPQELFDARTLKAVTAAGWTLTGDGQKFLFQISQDEANVAPFTVVLNWAAEMKK